MPGSIKIDDGSGNYTILTNAGSLGSDKTLTIPNETATLATTTASNLGGLVYINSGEIGSFELGNLKITINSLDTYEHNLIKVNNYEKV